MASSKSHKEDEDLRGQLREKDKLIKSLRKHIKKLEKERNIWEKTKDDDEDYHTVTPVESLAPMCPKCKKGQLGFTDLGIKMLKSCVSCGWRKVENK